MPKKPTLERYKNFYKRTKELETETSRWNYYFEEIGKKLHTIDRARYNSRYSYRFDGVEFCDFEGLLLIRCYEYGAGDRNLFESFKPEQAFDYVWLEDLERRWLEAIETGKERSKKVRQAQVEKLKAELKQLTGE